MMKIAVTASQPTLDAAVDPRFGRCSYFLVVDTDTGDFEALENPNAMLGGGAGIQAAQMIAQKGPAVLLTGNCGPNAFRALSAAGIQVIVGLSGTVRDAIQQFQAGRLQPAQQPSVTNHFGTSSGFQQDQASSAAETSSPPTDDPSGARPGRGMGRGGTGRGRGMGRRRGQGQGRGGGRKKYNLF
jgi:predicted Fe-Mo cluster-binding NifX family protein